MLGLPWTFTVNGHRKSNSGGSVGILIFILELESIDPQDDDLNFSYTSAYSKDDTFFAKLSGDTRDWTYLVSYEGFQSIKFIKYVEIFYCHVVFETI